MKKVIKVLAIILLVVVVVAGIFTALSWKYVSALITGLTTDEEELGQQRVENTVSSLSTINDYMDGELREITEEEKAAIQSGELSQTAVMAQIIAEAAGIELPDLSDFDENGNVIVPVPEQSGDNGRQDGESEQHTGPWLESPNGAETEVQSGASGGKTDGTAQSPNGGSGSSGSPSGGNAGGSGTSGSSGSKPGGAGTSASSGQTSSGQASGGQTASGQTSSGKTSGGQTAASYDQIVAASVSRLYGLQGQYTGQINGMINRAKAEYDQLKKANGAASARSTILSKYAGEVASMETNCDAKVEEVLSELTSQLRSIGADTSIVGELRSAYNAEKSNQRAAYANRYMK